MNALSGLLVVFSTVLPSCEGKCPEPDRRYDPGVAPTDAYMEEEGEEPVCPGGLDLYVGDAVMTLVFCDEDWCEDGYDGTYCTTTEALDEWLAADCPGCVIGEFRDNPYYTSLSCNSRR